jgi:hypothetical protein
MGIRAAFLQMFSEAMEPARVFRQENPLFTSLRKCIAEENLH